MALGGPKPSEKEKAKEKVTPKEAPRKTPEGDRAAGKHHEEEPPPELERLFDCPSSATTKTKAARAARPLPKEVFWHVLSFWRSSRDD